jgi:cephalosporin-C deacetylase-like acetyl esterase
MKQKSVDEYREEIDAMSKFDDRRVPFMIDLAKMDTIDAATLFRREVETSMADMDDNIYSPAKLFPLFENVIARKDRRYYDLFPRYLGKCKNWHERLSEEEARDADILRERAGAIGAVKTRWWQVWRTRILAR